MHGATGLYHLLNPKENACLNSRESERSQALQKTLLAFLGENLKPRGKRHLYIIIIIIIIIIGKPEGNQIRISNQSSNSTSFVLNYLILKSFIS